MFTMFYNIALYFHWAYSFRVVVVVGAADAAIVYVPHHGAQNACEMNKGLYGCKEWFVINEGIIK